MKQDESKRALALNRFSKTCFLCPKCDGRRCRGQVPGMGGVGTGTSFFNNLTSLEKYCILPQSVIETRQDTVSLHVDFFGCSVLPFFVAPMSGVKTNMGGGLSEFELNFSILHGAREAGTFGMTGDGRDEERYVVCLKALRTVGSFGVPIFKPRSNNKDIMHRIRCAEEIGVPAIGMDVDAVGLTSMRTSGIVGLKTWRDVEELVRFSSIPFVLKGIMQAKDAKRAVDVGVSAIYVSNHGGRVMDGMPGVADVLADVVDGVPNDILILADGGFRTGEDVLKGLALGADFIGIGRPAAIAAYSDESTGVCDFLNGIALRLQSAMAVAGFDSPEDLKHGVARNALIKIVR